MENSNQTKHYYATMEVTAGVVGDEAASKEQVAANLKLRMEQAGYSGVVIKSLDAVPENFN